MSAGRVHEAQLLADSARVVATLFLPGEEVPATHSRATQIVARVLAIPADDIERRARQLREDFAPRHPDTLAIFAANAEVVSSRLSDPLSLSDAQRIVLGAAFTMEFAVEGAALCNPSAVEHPDQSGLAPDELRVALSLRAIGEGHLSSIGFGEAIIGPGPMWRFVDRARPLARPVLGDTEWSRSHFRVALEHEGIVDELSSAVLRHLPATFDLAQLEAAIASLPAALRTRGESHRQVDAIRDLAASSYRAVFSTETTVSQRTLMPVAAAEQRGMEDARLVRFTDEDGRVDYRATYTAYDGRDIAPRLMTSPDLRSFTIHRLAGTAAHNKGMALFPRPVGGRLLSLSRTNGESISLARSDDGLVWTHAGDVHAPREPWEMIQTGNCGSPLETPEGWIVLIHGVGPMRTYALGAILLDLDDPSVVIARTREPLLLPEAELREGYVPSVIYSCGGLIHEGTLWVPIGIGDARIGVYSIAVAELLDAMTREGS